MTPASQGTNLFLFDIDGTILRGGTEVHREAFAYAYAEIFGLPLSLDGIPPSGRTDTWLFAEPLRRRGMPDDDIWARMPAAFELMQAYAEQHLHDLRDRVLPGVPEVLAELAGRGQLLGLLTGNLSRIAQAKMRHAGLNHFFAIGGYGEESEIRSHLVPVALAEAAHLVGHPIPPGSCVVIGDTPMDVEAGRAHETRTVAVATGRYSLEELNDTGADLVFPSFENVESIVARMMALLNQREEHGS